MSRQCIPSHSVWLAIRLSSQRKHLHVPRGAILFLSSQNIGTSKVCRSYARIFRRCATCRSVRLNDFRGGKEVQQKPSFTDLRKSAESGCDLCHLSYTAITTEEKAARILEWEGEGHDTVVSLEGRIYDDLPLKKVFHSRARVWVRCGKQSTLQCVSKPLKLYALEGTPTSNYIAGRMRSLKPLDPRCLTLTRGWLKTCDERHETCPNFSTKLPLPTRVLDIEGNKPIVLVTKGREDHYVALSYCWGTSGKNICLTKTSYDEFTSTGVEFDRFPRTVCDAITVCRTLGIKYLWINALCIIQEGDNSADFRDEAPRMCEYYSNSYFTLIAGSARDCADGFLKDRAKPLATPCEFQYDRPSQPLYPESQIAGTVTLGLPAEDGPAFMPIETRAWTYQEMYLSRRYLVYHDSQLKFRCGTWIAHEEGDFQNVSPLYENWGSGATENSPNPLLHRVLEHDNKEEARKYAYRSWHASIGNYTRRNMSRASDKLAAIAGMAKFVQSIVHRKYMYGLWEGDMVRGLYWQRIISGARPAKGSVGQQVKDRAPSWSWASIDGAVVSGISPFWQQALEGKRDSYLEILSHDRVSGALDPIGHPGDIPKAFELNVRVLMARIEHFWTMSDEVKQYLAGRDGNNPSFMVSSYRRHGYESEEDFQAPGQWDSTEDSETKTYYDQDVSALQLSRLDGGSAVGLLLAYVDGTRYRRIGSFFRAGPRSFEGEALREITLI